ncbi:MAG: LpxL/LpxP family Kdo(2)-lipid IV(A) lauroyl/palmitoleoyl acyltransferase [Chromatiales bacterium]|nr:LpxL/LpxP family Kdo(2)-lipid IV(A) lauroyl/palmitoleoyl acyltransferase [Chromatiales bacterium]
MPASNTPTHRKTHSPLAPKYWPSWVGLTILRGLHLLPFSWQLQIGRILGRGARHLLKSRAKIARINIDLCFPDLSKSERQAMLHGHFEAIGMGLFESAMTWWGSDKRISALGDIQGLEHLRSAAEKGQGVIFLTGHFSTMEIASTLVSIKHRISGMYRPMKNPIMDSIVRRSREQRSITLFQRDDIPTMIRCLKRGEAVWYGFDQNYGMKHSIFTPFFNIPAATITTTSRFAKMTNAVVIPFFPVRTANGRYHITIHPPLNHFPSGDVEQDNIQLNQLLEQAILQAPEQYFWMHRRFKTRPDNIPSVY